MVVSLQNSFFGQRVQPQAAPSVQPRQDAPRPFEPVREPAQTGERRSSPAVSIRLSKEAIAFLNGEPVQGAAQDPKAQPRATARAAFAHLAEADSEFNAEADGEQNAAHARAPYRPAAAQGAVPVLPPGSQLDISI